MSQLSLDLPLPTRPELKALALKRTSAVEAAAIAWRFPEQKQKAREIGVAFCEFWYAASRAGVRLPYKQKYRRLGMELALAKWPNDRWRQGEFVGLSPRQFRASALGYGLINGAGFTKPAAFSKRIA
jgi:hypothetical protein